ncbi:MAG: hypothetical protein IT204_13595 [Fimbriimonadaceae bacterium]|nr:hypothetical protein [Fimbriimonadaceae bacterium]
MSWMMLLLSVGAPTGQPLVTFDAPLPAAQLETRGVTASVANGALRVQSRHDQDWPGLTLKPAGGPWDLRAAAEVVADLVNTGPTAVELALRVDNAGADGNKHCLTGRMRLEAGASGTLRVPLDRDSSIPGVKLFGMRGYPVASAASGRVIDPAKVVAVLLFVPKPTADHQFELRSLRADGVFQAPPADLTAANFFPFIDTFGQYIHRAWPGKVTSLDDLRSRVASEEADLTARPGPAGWDEYGGWAAGPQLPASGFFRTQRVDGKWWLVDPLGRLYFSHGVDCVRADDSTPIDERETWFADFPGTQPELAGFLGKSSAIHNHYAGRSFRCYNFLGANLHRKYGAQWREPWQERTHRRLRSWGLNTIANWSEPQVYLQRRTPYVLTVGSSAPPIEGSSGYWGKFKDVFHADFRANLAKTMQAQLGKAAGDPWCVGIFIDNEIGWGDELSLALGTLQSPATQPAKLAFVADLRAKYGEIARLNAVWQTSHASWEALLEHTQAPDKNLAGDDLKAFYTKLAETYFSGCREAVKAVAPQQLYFGCRFAWVNDRAALAAAKYVDVISYNLYRKSVADFKLPAGIALPIIIGEFHFGALDRGMFHTGLQACRNQEERAATYRSYVEGALRHPQFVGTHWFKLYDQAATGRTLDAENYQIGFLDGCDTPYPETIAAVREVGYRMYEIRSGR